LHDGIRHWEEFFGYRQATEIVTNTRQKVNVVFLEKMGSISVKLVEACDITSAISSFAMKGGGLHHLCFRCSSIDHELARLSALGARVLFPSQPGEAFENEKIAFVYCKMGLNIELIDTDKRVWLMPG
jgi:methylmalonyl-CoA/ethylmalonyl-CoA epimerase